MASPYFHIAANRKSVHTQYTAKKKDVEVCCIVYRELRLGSWVQQTHSPLVVGIYLFDASMLDHQSWNVSKSGRQSQAPWERGETKRGSIGF
ncbi:MAG: hypothetical protein Q9187_006369 [Circinaria calcarea]